MSYYYMNLALFICSLLLLGGYFFVVWYFSYSYKQVETPNINSSHDVVGNNEVTNIVLKVQDHFGLNDYSINYGSDIKYSNFGRGINHQKKEINIARLPMISIGYELDYVISRIWFAKSKKNSSVRFYAFCLNYLVKAFLFLAAIFFVIQLVWFIYGVSNNYGQDISNSGVKFLWKVPLWFILVLCCLAAILVINISLKLNKDNLEVQYNSDILKFFSKEYPQFSYDLKSARTYSEKIRIGYNFAIFAKGQQRLTKWIGPFLNY